MNLKLSGESIPIRLFLAGYDLTPTMRDVGKKFSVRYYLNLVLVDEEDRRYFKQQVRYFTMIFITFKNIYINQRNTSDIEAYCKLDTENWNIQSSLKSFVILPIG